MASLQKKGGSYYCQFCHHGKRFTFTVGAISEAEAHAKAAQVDYILLRLKQRLIELPAGVDIVTFLQFDGKPPETAPTIPTSPRQTVTLAYLKDRYLATHGNGAMEANSLGTVAIHLNHIARSLGEQYPLTELNLDELQRHLDARARTKHHGRPLSPVTLKKEITSFRAMWNWGMYSGMVTKPFPSKGLVYPKDDEKPPFQTWAEITRQIEIGNLPEKEQERLWDCLFLELSEIAELLAHVQAKAAHGWIFPMVCTAAHTGARRSELLRIQARDVDLSASTILIHEKKRARGRRTTRRVPMSPFLSGVLKEWLASHPGGPFLFCHAGEIAESA